MLGGHESIVRDIRYSRDGFRVITASMDGTVRVWDASSGELLALLHGGVGPILAATEISKQGTILALSMSGKLQRWNKSAEDPDPARIAEVMECYSPWTIDSGGIVSRVSIPSKCVGAEASR
jgi:WD40 repeat protein